MTMDVHRPEMKRPLNLLLQGILALTALTAVVAGALGGVNAQWFTLGFEVVVLAAAVLGMLAVLGRPPYGQPLALACVAGAVAAASFLESIGVDRGFLGVLGRRIAAVSGPGVTIHLDFLLVFRLAVAAALAAAAGFLLMRRDWRASSRRLLLGVVLALAAIGILAGAWLGRGAIGGLAGPVRWGVAVVGFITVTGLAAAATQYLIDAFSAKRT